MIRAAFWLGVGTLTRTLREGLVLRSLIFPAGLVITTVLATVLVAVWTTPAPELGLARDTAPALRAALESAAVESDVRLLEVDDARKAVEREQIKVATDGTRLVVRLDGRAAIEAESAVRRALGSRWHQVPPVAHVRTELPPTDMNGHMIRIISVLFAFYGVVFSAGGVARDRSEGLIDAEFSLAYPLWLHGLVRWIANSLILIAALVASVAAINAVLIVPAPVSLTLHGIAAGSAGAAIGILVVGRHGLDRGFAAPLSSGLVLVASLLGLGLSHEPIAVWVPIASLFMVHASPVHALFTCAILGAFASWIFGARSRA